MQVSAAQLVGFVVDELLGQEEVVIKPLDDLLKGTPGMAGATITSDGGIALILDIPGLMRAYAHKDAERVPLPTDKHLAVEKNTEEALKWFKKAAELGEPNAQINLGKMYMNGTLNGTPKEKNPEKALFWIKKAVSQANSDAQAILGSWYYEGTGVKKDYDEADYVFYMDDSNLRYLKSMLNPPYNKLFPINVYSKNIPYIEDPWYSDRYALVVDEITECIKDIFNNI